MKELIARFAQIEKDIAREQGAFSLFALFQREGSDYWDVLVAAPWIDTDRGTARRLIAERIQRELSIELILKVARVVLALNDHPDLEAFHRQYRVEHGIIEGRDFDFSGQTIERAYIITSQPSAEKPEVRTTRIPAQDAKFPVSA